MSAAKDSLASEGLPALRQAPAQSPEQLSRAALLVEQFASEHTLPALDGLLAAAGEEETAPAARALIETAREASERTELLIGEVERFLAVSPAASQAAPGA